jgi:soluble lytic murein transglycosylase-like protein
MAACKIDLRDMIVAEANGQDVPPEIALAVATQESGLCHWAPSGNVLRGKAGEYGVMQLMPATAAALGVDPTDVNDNIHGGVKYLRQIYDRYGDWTLAVQRYNGSGPAAQRYATRVMAIARGYGFGLAMAAQISPESKSAAGSKSDAASAPPPPGAIGANGGAPSISANTLVAVGIVAGAGLLGWAIAS